MAWQLVQFKTASTSSVTLDSATASGNLIVVATSYRSTNSAATGVSSIADSSGGGTYVKGGGQSLNTSNGFIVSEIWHKLSSASGITSVTVTPTGTPTTIGVVVMEFTSFGGTNTSDANSISNGTSTSITLSYVTQTSGDLGVSTAACTSTFSTFTGTGYALVDTPLAQIGVIYNTNLGTNGSKSLTLSQSAATQMVGTVLAYKQTGGGSGPSATIIPGRLSLLGVGG